MSSIKYGILPIRMIEELIQVIESHEALKDQMYGECRNAEEIKEDGDLPDLYFELIAAKQNAWTLEKSERNEKKRKSIMKLTRDYSRIAEPDKTIQE